MKIKVLLFRDAVSILHSKLKLLSFILNSPNVLDTLISVGRLFHNALINTYADSVFRYLPKTVKATNCTLLSFDPFPKGNKELEVLRHDQFR